MSVLWGPGLFLLFLRSSGDKLDGIKWSYLFLGAQTRLLQAGHLPAKVHTPGPWSAPAGAGGGEGRSRSPGLSPPLGVHRGGGGAPGKGGVAGLRGCEMQPVEPLWAPPLWGVKSRVLAPESGVLAPESGPGPGPGPRLLGAWLFLSEPTLRPLDLPDSISLQAGAPRTLSSQLTKAPFCKASLPLSCQCTQPQSSQLAGNLTGAP